VQRKPSSTASEPEVEEGLRLENKTGLTLEQQMSLRPLKKTRNMSPRKKLEFLGPLENNEKGDPRPSG